MPEEMRRNQHLITDDVMRFMAEYDVRRVHRYSQN